MRRTSFFGALTAIAIGGVFAFAIQSSPNWLDLRVAGMIVMIAGIADLLIRFAIRDDPLLSQEAADVAAVVEPLGEPVLDVFGNPIRPAETTVLQPPAPASITTTVRRPAIVEPAVDDGLSASEVDDGTGGGPVTLQNAVAEPPDALTPHYALTGRPVRVGRRRRR
jgi:hypothetical protein